MERRIVADSSSNVYTMPETPGMSYACAPLKMYVGGREFVDDEFLDLPAFLSALKACKTKTSTSSPNIGDWMAAFEDADEVFAVALTSGISSGYNSALTAASLCESRCDDMRIHVIDSKSTGPELELFVEKYAEYIAQDLSFDEIVENIEAYKQRTHLMFMLRTVDNFARNGRVSPAVASVAGTLNIRIVGQASDLGELQMLNKVRGEKPSFDQLYANMKAAGFEGGKVRLRHTLNPEAAQILAELILADYPECDLTIAPNGGLCSYYAETGSVLVGFESRA